MNDEWFYEPKLFYFEFFHTNMLQTKKLTPPSLFLEKSRRPPQNKTKQEEEDEEEEGILPHIIYQ